MNKPFPRRSAAVAVSLAVVCLGGCITVLPKENPAQLYRFGAEPSAPIAAPGPAARVTIRAAPTSFERAAAGDRILTISGDQAAYIAGGRWVTSATSLFDAAVTRAFDVHGGPARLLARGEPAAADYVLKLDVRTFEVRYDHSRNAPPTVVVELYAALVGRSEAKAGASHLFQAEAPAGANAVHAIAGAFDVAIGKVLGEVVAWVDATAVA